MTEPIEPCRAMRDGKFCPSEPRETKSFVVCFVCRSFADKADWNTLQRDRLDAARWRHLAKYEGDFDWADGPCNWDAMVKLIDRAIGAEKENDNGA